MKKLLLVITIATIATQVQAQKMKTKEVPLAVSKAFAKSHPTTKDVDWSKDGNNYEVEYDVNKIDMSITYTPTGNVIETEMEINASSLPNGVMEYVKTNYKEDEVKEASKITDANGVVTYEAEVKGMDLIFDSKGKYLKSIKADAAIFGK